MDLHSASVIALRDCLGTKPGERVLIVSDEPMRKLAQSLLKATKELGNDVVLVEILPRSSNGEEPPAEIAGLMKAFDIVLCPTSKSMTHTDARREACAHGVRIATLPNVSEEIMIRCMNADYGKIAERTLKLCELLEQSQSIRVRAPAGTDITMPIRGRKAFSSSGMLREKGQWGNLPTGEAYIAPEEGKSNGVVVVDGSMATIGIVVNPVRIMVENGYATEISGGAEAEMFKELIAPFGKDARTVAEFGIGTNDQAILSGKIIEDEKVMGTIHIAFGDNKSMGGSIRVASHLDGLVRMPTVWFDDQLIMKNGKFVVTL